MNACLGACTRGNPAFGLDDETDGEAATATAAERGDDHGSDPSSTTRTDDGDDAADGEKGSTGSMGDTEELDDSTGGIDICQPHAPEGPFLVKELVDGRDVQPTCGETITISGMLASTNDGQLTVLSCPSSPCSCAQGTAYGFATTLHPSPAELYQNQLEACISVTLRRAPEEDGCFVRSLVVADRNIESTELAAPRLIAANEVALDLTDPSIELGELLEGCRDERGICARPPGRYELKADRTRFTVGLGPEPMWLTVGEFQGDYLVQALRASVDESCQSHVSWLALGTE